MANKVAFRNSKVFFNTAGDVYFFQDSDACTCCGDEIPCEAGCADFSYEVVSCANDEAVVNFTYEGDCTCDSAVWDFGDGNTNSSDVNPQHTYTTQGVYVVCLTVTGCDEEEALGQNAPCMDCLTVYACPENACVWLEDCLERNGSITEREVEVTVSGITDNSCTECEVLNGTFLLGEGVFTIPQVNVCRGLYSIDIDDPSACGTTSRIGVGIGVGGSTEGIVVEIEPFKNVFGGLWLGPEPEQVSVARLCAGETVTLELDTFDDSDCVLSGATVTIRFV